MWFRYVQLTTNIFTTTKDGQTRILNYSQVKRKRDDLKDFVPFDSIHRPSPKVMTGSKLDEGDALELSSEIAREDFYEGMFNFHGE